jgi:hypothetical protein
VKSALHIVDQERRHSRASLVNRANVWQYRDRGQNGIFSNSRYPQSPSGNTLTPLAVSRDQTCACLPSQIAKSGPFTDELYAKQYTKQPDSRQR